VKKQRLQHWIFALDIVWILVATMTAYVLRYGFTLYPSGEEVLQTFLPVVLVTVLLWAGLFSRMKLDGFRLGWDLPTIVSQLFLATCLVLAGVLAVGYLARHYLSRLLLAYWGVILLAGFLGTRRLTHAILRSRYLQGTMRRLVIVGNGPVAREMASKIERHPEMLCQVVGNLCSAEASLDSGIAANGEGSITVQTLGVTDLLREHRVDEIIITLSKPGAPEVMSLAAQCRREGISVSIVPHPYDLYLSTPQLLDIGGLPVLQLHETNARFANGASKRLLDLVLTCILLPFALPVMIFGSLGLLKKSGGPFTRELRCGQFGKPFWMYRLNSDRNSTQLPPFEQLLQQLSITELPQLWNVLRGEMSLVGPRPEAQERVKHYSDWQHQRLNVRPGITGLAQVHGLREQHSSEEKARFDLQYMLHSSPFSDISLLLQSGWTLMVRLFQPRRVKPSFVERAPEGSTPTEFEGCLSDAHSTQSSAD
jgi:lipopolysaccharide/colanic/teichoic acid biosynthesis glycosyltransferase